MTMQALIQSAQSKRKLKAKTTKALQGRFSDDLYVTPEEAFTEIIQNSFDASRVANMQPHAHIEFQNPGDNPHFPETPCLVAWDEATGILEKKLEPLARDDDPNRFGIGRLGIMNVANPNTKEVILLTRCSYERVIRMYHFKNGNFFASDEGTSVYEFKRTELPQELQHLPEGPFTMYIVPDWNQAFTPEELGTFLSERLPLHDWEVTINGERIEPYDFDQEIAGTTDFIQEFDATIEVQLGLKPHEDAPGIWLVDQETRRKVAPLETGSKKLKSIFKNDQLTGYVILPGLEQEAITNRHGLKGSFFQGQKMVKFYKALELTFLKQVEELLQQESPNKKQEVLEQVQKAFAKKYQPQRAPGKKDSTNKGVGNRRRRRRAQIKIQIENRTFTVSTNASRSPIPAEIRKETIVLFGANDTIRRIMGLKSQQQQVTSLIEIICEAYALAEEGHETPAQVQERKYQLSEEVISQITK